jgi:hypothetical protein
VGRAAHGAADQHHAGTLRDRHRQVDGTLGVATQATLPAPP